MIILVDIDCDIYITGSNAYLLASCIGNLTTPNSIAEYMKTNGSKITNETVDAYLRMLENAFFIYRVLRYELR